MPELPEVETVVRSLSQKLRSLEISGVKLFYRPILRNKNLSFIPELKGRKISGVRRRGKMILIDLDRNISLIFHLKMTGQFLFYSRRMSRDKHTHFILSFKGQKKELRFRDVRKFGFISCVQTSEAFSSKELRELGPEPLEVGFPAFQDLFQGRKARLKSLLLNQNFIAGIGNIYSDEILFRAKLYPLISASRLSQQELRRLWKSMREVLRNAIGHRGSSIRDFIDAEGRKGSFQNRHQVYGRESLPCFICGESIERLRLGGRSSFFCPGCQKIQRKDKGKN